MNNIVNKIVNSNKLYTTTIIIQFIVVCVFLSSSVQSRPNSSNKFENVESTNVDIRLDQNKLTTPSPKMDKINALNNQKLNLTKDDLESSTKSSNKTANSQIAIPRKMPINSQIQVFKNLDYPFIFRLFVFISAFCLAIFASVFVKSLNGRPMYGYLDTKCADEERLMAKNGSDYWDEDDEIVVFDAVDFKKGHYKD